jgi:hypothetical protein
VSKIYWFRNIVKGFSGFTVANDLGNKLFNLREILCQINGRKKVLCCEYLC